MNAVNKYYQQDNSQRTLHQQLLQAVRRHIANNGSKEEYLVDNDEYSSSSTLNNADDVNDDSKNIRTATAKKVLYQSPIERFAYLTAGKPLLYGICLQKQHLDPHHYPRKLIVRNGYRPYMYR